MKVKRFLAKMGRMLLELFPFFPVAAVVAVVVIIVAASAGVAQAGSWVPGSNYRVQEDDMNSFVEKRLDHAYCTGIPRFGHSGEFPYEEFHVFDCDVTLNGVSCTNWRVAVIKASEPGYFRLKKIHNPTDADCF